MPKKNNLEPTQQDQGSTFEIVSSPNNHRLRKYIKSHGWLRVEFPNLNPDYWLSYCPDLFKLPEILQGRTCSSSDKLLYDEMCPTCGKIITRKLSTSPLNEEKTCPACQSNYKNPNTIDEGVLPWPI